MANWEGGRRLPDIATLSRLAGCLGVEPDALLDTLREPGETPRIVAVEDVPVLLKGIVRTLEETLPAAEIRGFRTGAEALAFARDCRVAIAFLDIELPGEDGVQLARELREIEGKTNVIFLTCHTEYMPEALYEHCSGYILKPLTREKLLHELDNLRYPVGGLDL